MILKTIGLIVVLSLFSTSCVSKRPGMNILREEIDTVRSFIKGSWEKTVRFSPENEGDLIGLPYKYTVPSISNSFQSMFYWDTYFTGEGLIIDGHVELAQSNVGNMLSLVERYGKMLNGNRTYFENRSQPPYLSMMVESVYKETKDKKWLRDVLPTLKKEYDFWMSRRISPIGLNHYSNEATVAQKKRMITILNKRLGENFQKKNEGLTEDELLKIGSHFIAECESGWDFTPRFQQRCEDFCPIDLNANLYYYEKNFEYFASELGNQAEANDWLQKAKKRKNLINQYCRDNRSGVYYDYDYINHKHSGVVSAAIFSLLYAQVLSKEEVGQIKNELLDKLEYPYGISACEKKDYGYVYQWSYPNGWAPLNYLAVRGLNNYGLKVDAKRISEKYLSMVIRSFKETNNLWEKYNIVEGNVKVVNEYAMPAMIGWTAGTFVWISNYLDGN